MNADKFKRELEQLRAQRRTPALKPGYTIGGEIQRSVHKELDAAREKRIRLLEIRGHATNEFGVSQHRARAVKDFERSR